MKQKERTAKQIALSKLLTMPAINMRRFASEYTEIEYHTVNRHAKLQASELPSELEAEIIKALGKYIEEIKTNMDAVVNAS